MQQRPVVSCYVCYEMANHFFHDLELGDFQKNLRGGGPFR